ncbi:DUF488 domain-containing protein [Thermomonas sp.]|uniref:DUF488 domain-containing protein n=1 Tax=Thermomonas sp. TaxID=1971895 RepID=UPI00248867B9|nr:DUF488 domain-containing protein [Thermomonas sp.]MDI1253950.1 DUF488 domain-containing protein [Thermomonas sp.]
MGNGPTTIHTIGHSTRPLDEFIGLLQAASIQCVVDVRRLPGSRAYPQYNADALQRSLADAGIEYWHLLALAGRRRASEIPKLDDDDAPFWTNPSFRRYAAYAHTKEFHAGLQALEQRAKQQACAVMCAEAVWWRCHRRIISDYLLADGIRVLHIMSASKVEVATLTKGACVIDAQPIYPPNPNPDEEGTLS